MTLNLSPSHLFRSLLLVGAALAAMGAAISAQEPVPTDKPGPLSPALQSLVDRHVIAGAVVLVADGDKVLDLEAAGYSSLATKAPMKTDALFWIASMTKSITGTALMMLVDEGKLSLDDPVEKYLPEFKGQMVKEENAAPHPPQHSITIREVMDHTSGLVKANDPALKRTGSLKDNVAQFAALPLLREPGTKFEYNNSGINTGARVVEVIAGMPYAEFMQQRLFTPLDMKETTFWPNEELGKRLASSTKATADKSGLEDINLESGDHARAHREAGAWRSGSGADVGEFRPESPGGLCESFRRSRRRTLLHGGRCGAVLPDAAEGRHVAGEAIPVPGSPEANDRCPDG